jgi:hypothetical protein
MLCQTLAMNTNNQQNSCYQIYASLSNSTIKYTCTDLRKACRMSKDLLLSGYKRVHVKSPSQVVHEAIMIGQKFGFIKDGFK